VKYRVLHFVLGGVALFAINAFLSSPGNGKALDLVVLRAPIVISSAQVAQLRADYTRQTGLIPSADEEKRLIEEAIEEEVLYREALARGLHRGDRSIRYRLIQKMRFVANDEEADDEQLYRQALEMDLGREDLVIRRLLTHKIRFVMKLSSGVGEPTDEELQAYLEENRDRYQQPARISFTHVFLSAEKRGDSLIPDAQGVLGRIKSEAIRGESAISLGDRFVPGHEFGPRSAQALEKTFGPGFARKVFELEPGEWSDPVPSAYGVHLVWVEEITPERLPPLESVRTRVAGALKYEERERRFREMVAELLQQYEVTVEGATGQSGQRPS